MASDPVDFRKGHDGLTALVQSQLRQQPFDGSVYVFRSKRADRLKMIYRDCSGLVMAYKRLEALIAAFNKALFGAKSEKIYPDQYELELEDIETGIAQIEAEVDADARTAPVRPPKQRKTNRGSLPKHLERVELVIEPEATCGCGAERHVIGEDVSARRNIIPAQFRVIETRRPKYACRSCEAGISQAPAPAHIITGDMPTEATLAHVIVSKYADHLPLYRQAQIYSRQGIDLERSAKLFMDETIAPVLDPGRKRTKTGYFGHWRVTTGHGQAKPPRCGFCARAIWPICR